MPDVLELSYPFEDNNKCCGREEFITEKTKWLFLQQQRSERKMDDGTIPTKMSDYDDDDDENSLSQSIISVSLSFDEIIDPDSCCVDNDDRNESDDDDKIIQEFKLNYSSSSDDDENNKNNNDNEDNSDNSRRKGRVVVVGAPASEQIIMKPLPHPPSKDEMKKRVLNDICRLNQSTGNIDFCMTQKDNGHQNIAPEVSVVLDASVEVNPSKMTWIQKYWDDRIDVDKLRKALVRLEKPDFVDDEFEHPLHESQQDQQPSIGFYSSSPTWCEMSEISSCSNGGASAMNRGSPFRAYNNDDNQSECSSLSGMLRTSYKRKKIRNNNNLRRRCFRRNSTGTSMKKIPRFIMDCVQEEEGGGAAVGAEDYQNHSSCGLSVSEFSSETSSFSLASSIRPFLKLGRILSSRTVSSSASTTIATNAKRQFIDLTTEVKKVDDDAESDGSDKNDNDKDKTKGECFFRRYSTGFRFDSMLDQLHESSNTNTIVVNDSMEDDDDMSCITTSSFSIQGHRAQRKSEKKKMRSMSIARQFIDLTDGNEFVATPNYRHSLTSISMPSISNSNYSNDSRIAKEQQQQRQDYDDQSLKLSDLIDGDSNNNQGNHFVQSQNSSLSRNPHSLQKRINRRFSTGGIPLSSAIYSPQIPNNIENQENTDGSISTCNDEDSRRDWDDESYYDNGCNDGRYYIEAWEDAANAALIKEAHEMATELEETLHEKGFESPYHNSNQVFPKFSNLHLQMKARMPTDEQAKDEDYKEKLIQQQQSNTENHNASYLRNFFYEKRIKDNVCSLPRILCIGLDKRLPLDAIQAATKIIEELTSPLRIRRPQQRDMRCKSVTFDIKIDKYNEN